MESPSSGFPLPFSQDVDSPTRNHITQSDKDLDNDPPYSRLFVICGRSVTEEDLVNLFSTCGSIESCKTIKDKTTNESKGVAYIKFSKASSAAQAIDLLNGKSMPPPNKSSGDNSEESSHKSPSSSLNLRSSSDQPQKSSQTTVLKVMIADVKGASSRYSKTTSKEPEDTPARSRLFLTCSKELTEEQISEKFREFEDFEYSYLMKDKETGESKGCAYVKFQKALSAAIAMETINSSDSKIKALIANPRTKRSSSEHGRPNDIYPFSLSNSHHSSLPLALPSNSIVHPYMPMPIQTQFVYPSIASSPLSRQRLFVVHHKGVTQEQLSRLFGRFQGMEYCDLKKDKKSGESKGFAYINYSTPHAAMMAKDQLDGIEYPSGYTLKVAFAEPLGVPKSPAPSRSSTLQSNNSSNPPLLNHSHPNSSNSSLNSSTDPLSLSEMRDNFAQMMAFPHPSMLYTRNHYPIQSQTKVTHPAPSTNSNSDTNDKSIHPPGSRLFVVQVGKMLPEYVLHDVFSQFAGLEYIRMHKEKNYGYVKYSTAVSAQYAMTYLDTSDVGGTKLKGIEMSADFITHQLVQVASAPTESRNKRQKT